MCVLHSILRWKKVHTFHLWLCVNKCRRSIFIDTISQSLWVNLYRLLFPLQISHSQMFLCRYLTHWPLDWLPYFHTTIARSLSNTFRMLYSIYNDIECMFVVWFIVSTNELERRTRPKNAHNFFSSGDFVLSQYFPRFVYKSSLVPSIYICTVINLVMMKRVSTKSNYNHNFIWAVCFHKPN